jgi:putative ABC transport system ATP-binding protein
MNHMLQVENLSKIYNRRRPDEIKALDDVTLKISRGEAVVFKGASGSGKTTLLSLLGCMARPTAGSIRLDDRDVARLPEKFLAAIRLRTYGFIFQHFNLIRNLSVVDNVMLPLCPTDMGVGEMRERVSDSLKKLNLGDREKAMVKKLSGGEQQRVAIARALVNRPEIIVADEPTAHLDSHLTGELLEILGRFKEQGKTLIIATHDPAVYNNALVDRVIPMRDGRVEGGD